MFYYYGAKNQLARHYPEPRYGLIVEPFAGSAGYAQCWRKFCDVTLVEKDERVVALWERLQAMSADEIMDLPTPVVDSYTDDFLVMLSAASNSVMRIKRLKVTPRVVAIWEGMKRRMAERVDDVRDWQVILGDYTDSPDVECTWFIDPPYQVQGGTTKTAFPQGRGYKHDTIDYEALGEWCQSRRGQVIVCEQAGADWLPDFKPLKLHHDSQGVLREEVFVAWQTTEAVGAHDLTPLGGQYRLPLDPEEFSGTERR